MVNIAVENNLHRYANYLRNEGYNVEEFYNSMKSNSSYFDQFDAVVVSEFGDNVLDIRDEVTGSSAINSGILNIQDSSSAQSAINSGLLNENDIGIKKHFTSKPTIYANGKSPEAVKNDIERLLH